jgi:hypothetical protein
VRDSIGSSALTCAISVSRAMMALQGRQHHAVARRFQHHAVRGVVDVFRGAGEVDELAGRDQFRHVLDLLLQPVFDGLDVVVGDGLDLLDAGGVRVREPGGQLVEQGARIA